VITDPLFLGTFPLYAISLSVTAALGLFLSWWIDAERRIFTLDAGLAIIGSGLLGARMGFVIRNFSYFLIDPLEMPQFWLGGLTWPGALLGSAGAIIGIHLIWKEPLGELADTYLPLFGTVVVGIWLLSWGSGTGYGPEIDSWFGIRVRDIYGVTTRRWPLPLLGAILSGAWTVATILFPLRRSRKPGFRAQLGIAGLILINLILSLFKVDPAPLLWGLRQESWFSLFILLIITAIYLVFGKRNGKFKT
jgi:prolipoprotein diacylglyceryltransferase